jgi:peptidoglycan/xylan/chitin deacetylase (PgdA/CDA1 family)
MLTNCLGAVFDWFFKMSGVVLYLLHLHRFIMRMNRRSPKVLVFHACEEAESDFLRGLRVNTTPARLRAQLDYLTRHYRVIPLDRLGAAGCPDYAVVLTFDDGYLSVKRNALPLLRERGLPATAYVVTDVIGNRRMVWVNELNWFLHRHPAVARPIAARYLGGRATTSVPATIERARQRYEPVRMDALLAELRSAAGVDVRRLYGDSRLYLDWQDVEEMCGQGITFGNHTATHPNLARLTEAQQHGELVRARAALAGWSGAANSLAYPFGNHNAISRALAQNLGFESVMAVGGVNRPLDRYGIARVVVFGGSAPLIFAELEVLAPVKALIRSAVSRLRTNAVRLAGRVGRPAAGHRAPPAVTAPRPALARAPAGAGRARAGAGRPTCALPR